MKPVDELKKGRNAYSVMTAITIGTLLTQHRVVMSAGLVINAVIWWLTVYEVQCDISRMQRERDDT